MPRSSRWASSAAWPGRAGAAEQGRGAPAADWGRLADHFGKAHKAFFITADSMTYDFGRLAPLDFAFLDGGHDLEHVLNDSRKAYEALAPGGWLVWHDFDSPVPWVRVREAIERLGFAEPVMHVAGTEVAFLRKQAPAAVARHGLPRRTGPVRVAWEGDFEGLHSLALVNRALCRELLDRGHDLGLIPVPWARRLGAGPRCRSTRGWRRGWTAAPKGGRRRCTCGTGGRRGSSRRRRALGADAALGVRQPAQGLAAHAPPRRRGLGL